MMWRRQFVNSLPLFANQQANQQNRNLDELNAYIKILRKKEDLYFRLCDIEKRNDEQIDMQIHLNLLKKEMDRLRSEQSSLIRNLQDNSGLAKDNKTALYSLLSRILEILEITKQRLQLLDGKYAITLENQKRVIYNQYNQQLYTGNYDMTALVALVAQYSNARISSQLLPMTKRIIMGQNSSFKSEELSPLKKKSMSDAVLRHPSKDSLKTGTSLLELLTSRKLKNRSSKKKIFCEQESPQKSVARKNKKTKKIFDKLYGVIEAKNIYTDPVYTQCETKEQFQQKLYETAKKKNQSFIRIYDEFSLQYEQYNKKKQEKAYRIRNRKTRNDDNWVRIDPESLSKIQLKF